MSDPWEAEELVGYSTYDADEFTSGPKLSANSTLTTSALSFFHSFGYDCSLRNNLHALDSRTLAFVTGNLIHFLNPVSITRGGIIRVFDASEKPDFRFRIPDVPLKSGFTRFFGFLCFIYLLKTG